jgi:hypothetical protein
MTLLPFAGETRTDRPEVVSCRNKIEDGAGGLHLMTRSLTDLRPAMLHITIGSGTTRQYPLESASSLREARAASLCDEQLGDGRLYRAFRRGQKGEEGRHVQEQRQGIRGVGSQAGRRAWQMVARGGQSSGSGAGSQFRCDQGW